MLTAERVLDEYYLEVRCKLLEIAAILDRYERAEGGKSFMLSTDRRWERCREAMEVLSSEQKQANRAERVALVFSDPV